MLTNELRQKLHIFETNLGIKKAQLNEARKIDGKRRQLLALVQESDALVEYLRGITEDLNKLRTIVSKEEVEFKERRLGFLEGCLTRQIDNIFPKKKLRAKINCNFDRRKMKLRLNIMDPNGNVRPPQKTEGKLNQQLISVTAAYGCTKLLRKNILYLDEPFSNSSEDNLIKLQKLLSELIDDGFQIILISQSPLLFVDIARRLILLRSTDGVRVDRVEYQDVTHIEGG